MSPWMTSPERRVGLSACLVALALGFPFRMRTAAAQEEFPETVQASIRRFEEDVELRKWLSGPVEYIILKEERDIWEKLETDEERIAFIRWFWDRRDDDPRDEQNPFLTEFYQRVADVNRRFAGFPRGWKSDRGRVWVILGRPSSMRSQSLRNFGRCSSPSGVAWVYFTNNISFRAQYGEFNIYFIEPRPGQYEVCDPTMLGPGAYPVNLRRAMEYTNEAWVLDPVTEFDASAGATPSALSATAVTEIVTSEEPLSVPLDGWGVEGSGGAITLPIQMRLRDLIFEPIDGAFVAKLQLETELVNAAEQRATDTRELLLALTEEELQELATSDLHTAVAISAPSGTYDASLRLFEPLSGKMRSWQGSVDVAEVAGLGPAIVGSAVVRLHEGGEVAVLTPPSAKFEAGQEIVVVAWGPGGAPDPESVAVELINPLHEVIALQVDSSLWGSTVAGPLIVRAVFPEDAVGAFTLRLTAGGDLGVRETELEIR